MIPQRTSTEENSDSVPRPTILIVDDEAVIRNAFQIFFETVGYSVTVAQGGDEAIEMFEARRGWFDIVLLDLVMPGTHGIDVLRRMKEIDNAVEVIIATGCGSMNTAIEAMRHGAFDYITKPVIDLDEDLLTVVRNALSHRRDKAESGFAGSRSLSPARVSPTEAGAADSAVANFYIGLECLARDTPRTAKRSRALEVLASLVEKHLKSQAFFVVEETPTREIVCTERFGPWSGILDPSLTSWPPGQLGAALARPFVWQRIQAHFSIGGEPGKGSPCHLEVLCVPVSGSRGGIGASPGEPARALLLLRRIQGLSSAPSPEGALLGLVAEKVLAISDAVDRNLQPALPAALP